MMRFSKFLAGILFYTFCFGACHMDDTSSGPATDPQWHTESLPRIAGPVIVTSVGTKTFFVGSPAGTYALNTPFLRSLVDVYNSNTNTWTTSDPNLGHCYHRAVQIGNKAVFLGNKCTGNDGIDQIDILDPSSNAWTSISLPKLRANGGVAIVGTKIVIAGGILDGYLTTDLVDIIETTTGQLTTAKISSPRSKIVTAVDGSLALFAGGRSASNTLTDEVDMYDGANNTWSTAKLSLARVVGTAIAADSKFVFYGGDTGPKEFRAVDIFDKNTSTWSSKTLDVPIWMGAPEFNSVVVGHSLVFSGTAYASSHTIDIFDTNSNRWIGDVGYARRGATLGAIGSKVFLAGGLEDSFFRTDRVSIFDIETFQRSEHQLAERREQITAVVIGTRLFFAGGFSEGGTRFPHGDATNNIEIFDGSK